MKYLTLCLTTITLSLLAGIALAQEKNGRSRIEAGDFDSSGGSLEASGGKLYYVKANAWTQYDSVDLHTGTKAIELNVANGGGDSDIEVWVDGTKVGTLAVGGTGGWNTYQTQSLVLKAPQSGIQTVKLVFVNGNVNVDWLRFSESAQPTPAKEPATVAKQPVAAARKLRASGKRLRVIMMSDFPPIDVVKGGNVPNTMKSDPDDMQSMVRFLLYANEFDIEGLVAAAGTFAMEAHKKNMLDVLDRYEKVYENLKTHDPNYPTADYLRSVTYEGLGNNHGLSIKWGSRTQPVSDIIGEGKDSEASNAIIAAADKPDPRPIWIGVWGGPREVSQAIWRVHKDRSEEKFNAFISKLRIFLIAYQDCTHSWLMDEFPDLFIIDSRKTYQGMFGGRDPISNLAWVNKHVRNNHGPLGEIYPHEGMGCTGVCEGDSPTFMFLVSANRGINDPEDPTQESWGGQYRKDGDKNHYIDGPGGSSISKWRKDYQLEFQERADWMLP